jgi:methanogenic corrinoid protein MtbC1
VRDDKPAVEVPARSKVTGTPPPSPAKVSSKSTSAGTVGGAIAMMVRRVVLESDRAVHRALRHASGRFAGMRFRGASPAHPPRSRIAGTRPHGGAPLPLRSIVAPLVEWTHSTATSEGAPDVAASLIETHMAREVLYANVVEACARNLGDQCADELCTDIDVTLALVRLQTLVRCLGATAPSDSFVPRSVLVAAAPEELHGLGMAIASECFRAAGWEVAEAPGASDATIASAMQKRHFDALVLSLSGANHRMERLAALSATIVRARSADADGHLVVLVTGRDFTDGIASARDVGADAACASAVDAPRSATALIDLQDNNGGA